jgi:1-acyl-sn-glycerol-3-phosphate acyltransferase
MIRQVVSMVLLNIWFIYSSFGIITPTILFQQEDKINNLMNRFYQSLLVLTIKYGFQPQIYYTNEIKQTKGKVDILISNHVATIDIFIILSILQSFGVSKYINVAKKDLIYFPGLGQQFMFGKHIKLARNWEEDKDTIDNQLANIEEGIIIIFPEGTRFDPKKFEEGQQFSKDNNYPVYNNLLVPKSKGLGAIINYLQKNNKLGKIYDVSLVIKNFFGKKAYMKELLSNKIGDVFAVIRELHYNNENFKDWLLTEWKKKDDLLSMYKNLVYQKLEYKHDIMIEIISLVFMIIVTCGLFNPTFRTYFLIAIIVTYIITYMRRNKFKYKKE